VQALTDAQAEVLVGKDRESHGRDLFQAIERGEFPKWKLFVQVMPELEAETYRIHPFDLTKVWPKSDYPLIEVGEFELNRNPVNWYQDVEQSAFAPSNLVPGIGPSPDKMLQARLFAYTDAQRYRLGVNHHQIPVNAARCPVFSNHRDGAMRVDGNYGGLPHYEPNSYGQWQEQPQYREPALKIRGDADFWNFREDDNDYFSQPGALFRSYSAEQKQRLFDNTARALGDAPDFIKQRHIDNCNKADPAYGAGIAAALQKLAAATAPADPFAPPPHPGSDFPTATPGAEDIEL
jgi:catalase